MSFAMYQNLDNVDEVFSLRNCDDTADVVLSSYSTQKVVVVSFIDLKAWIDSADTSAHDWLIELNTLAGEASFTSGAAALVAVLYRNGGTLLPGSQNVSDWLAGTVPVFPVAIDDAWSAVNQGLRARGRA